MIDGRSDLRPSKIKSKSCIMQILRVANLAVSLARSAHLTLFLAHLSSRSWKELLLKLKEQASRENRGIGESLVADELQ